VTMRTPSITNNAALENHRLTIRVPPVKVMAPV
jgi:hypothetical protein